MDDIENRRRQTFMRVQSFGIAHEDDFASSSLGKELFATLATIISELDGHASSEASGYGLARQSTTIRSQARERLRRDMEAIGRTARAMAVDVPGIEEKFRVPRNNNDQQLLAVARAFAAEAEPIAAQFTAHELSAAFLAVLNADIAGLEAAINSQSNGMGDHVAARAAIDNAIARGRDVVRKLDVIVKNKYANNRAVLAEWRNVSHTERTPRRHKTPAQPSGTSAGDQATDAPTQPSSETVQ